jgi:hypothetical protein
VSAHAAVRLTHIPMSQCHRYATDSRWWCQDSSVSGRKVALGGVVDLARRMRFTVGATLFLLALALVMVDPPYAGFFLGVAWVVFLFGFCLLPGIETVSRNFRAGYQDTRESTDR